MENVVRLAFVHQSENGASRVESSSEHGLQETVWTDLDDDGVLLDVVERFLEQHRIDEIVDEVVADGLLTQLRVPLGLRDGRAHPAGSAFV